MNNIEQDPFHGRKRRNSSSGITGQDDSLASCPKGEPGSVSPSLKEDILEAYKKKGGIAWLMTLPDRDFFRLFERIVSRKIVSNGKSYAQDALRGEMERMSNAELARLAHATGQKIFRLGGKVYEYDDADAALSLAPVQAIIEGIHGDELPEFAVECLEGAIAALRKRLPELAGLLPKAESALEVLRGRNQSDQPKQE